MIKRFPANISGDTRFAEAKELQSLADTIKQINAHAASLTAECGNKADHPAYKKSIILADFAYKLDSTLHTFNEETKANTPEGETFAMKVLVQSMRNLTNTLLQSSDYEILNTRRNNKKAMVDAAVDVTTRLGTGGITYASGFIMGLYSHFYLKPVADKKIKDWVGLTPFSHTIDLLKSFAETTAEIEKGLECKLGRTSAELMNLVSIDCPITTVRIVHPVLCSLDGRLYEKAAIEEWLTLHSTSPINRVAMKPGQSVADVLIETYSLRDALATLENEMLKLKLAQPVAAENKQANPNKQPSTEAEHKAPLRRHSI